MYKFTFLADLHYYSKILGTSGRAYELRSGSDQKCLAESGAIIDAAFDHLARSDTQAVLLAGDLTNDGEMVCHRELREKLDALQLPGRKLLPLYPLVKPLFRLLRTGTVRDLQRTLRRLGLGRYVDAQAAAELADRPILPYLEWILLQFMDGSAHPVGRDSAVYRLVLSVIEIPAHLLPGNMDMKKLIFACDAILTGGVGDHQQSIL